MSNLETPSLNRALDTFGNLNCLIDSGLNEIIKWCAKSTKDNTKGRKTERKGTKKRESAKNGSRGQDY